MPGAIHGAIRAIKEIIWGIFTAVFLQIIKAVISMLALPLWILHFIEALLIISALLLAIKAKYWSFWYTIFFVGTYIFITHELQHYGLYCAGTSDKIIITITLFVAIIKGLRKGGMEVDYPF